MAALADHALLWADPPAAAATAEGQLVRPDGTEVPIQYVATPLRPQPDSRPTGWVVVFRDISARRASEAALVRQVEAGVWLQRIRHALDDDGFVLHAQPIIQIATGQKVKHELLLRMRDRGTWGAVVPAVTDLASRHVIDAVVTLAKASA